MTHGKVDTEGLSFRWSLADIEELNRLALRGSAEMIKVSYHAWPSLERNYTLLDAGSALGSGNGPLLISKREYAADEVPGLTVAIPGEHTTAHFLLRYAFPEVRKKVILLFSEIENAILNGSVDAGVIIHESRFTYEAKGLRKILDLGDQWEQRTGFPIPLGGIVAKKALGYGTIHKLNRIMKQSVLWAMGHPEETMEFVRAHAQEMDEAVMRRHIGLYVNDYTVSLGPKGREAVAKMSEVILGRKTE